MLDNELVIQDLKNKIALFVKKRGWGKLHNPKNLSMSIAIEAAELMEIFQWLTIDESWDIINSDTELIHLKEELADVIIYCLSLSNQLGIDVYAAIEDKIQKNEQRFPEKID